MDPLDGVLQASPDAVVVVDDAGIIRRANHTVRDVLGYDPEALEGSVVEDLLPEELREDHVEYREAYLASPEPRPMGKELDLYARHADGSRVPVEISLGPFRQDGDLYVLATITDVTRRKERERQLERQNDRLERFASIVSHDLRNPLYTVSASLDLAEETGEPADFERCRDSIARMENLIDDVLAMARQGDQVTETEAVDLEAVGARAWESVRTTDASLRNAIDCTVRADDRRLQQLLENLFSNAVVHGREDVTVRIDAIPGGFAVADDGPGVPEDSAEAVFDRGFSTTPDGTGIGLTIVADVAEAHDWDYRVADAENGGARFEFTGVDVVSGRSREA